MGKGKVQVAAFITVVVFSLLVNLGYWQLNRGEEKKRIEQSMIQRESAPYTPLTTFVSSVSTLTTDSVNGVKVIADIAHTTNRLIYLDNQTFEGKVGYLVYQLFTLTDGQNHLMVELGFISGVDDRRTLPVVPKLSELSNLKGRLYTRASNPLSLDLMAEELEHIRIQNLNFAQLEVFTGLPIFPAVLQPDQLADWPLPLVWKPLPMPSTKHIAYAV